MKSNLLQSGNAQSWCDLEIEFITLKNNRAPLLYSFKLCASFYSHHWIQTGVSVRKRPIWVNNDYVLFCVSSNLDRWLWKTTGHLFCATSSFVHNFVAIDEFKLEVQFGNTQLGPKSTIFCLNFSSWKFSGWPWKTIGHLSSATSSFVHHFIITCEFKLELQSGNGLMGCWPLWPWPLTLTFCMDITSVIDNNKSFHDDTMMRT